MPRTTFDFPQNVRHLRAKFSFTWCSRIYCFERTLLFSFAKSLQVFVDTRNKRKWRATVRHQHDNLSCPYNYTEFISFRIPPHTAHKYRFTPGVRNTNTYICTYWISYLILISRGTHRQHQQVSHPIRPLFVNTPAYRGHRNISLFSAFAFVAYSLEIFFRIFHVVPKGNDPRRHLARLDV